MGKVLEGSNYNNPKEKIEDDMCDVMRRSFVENVALDEIQQLNPQSLGSVLLDLPLVLYNSTGNFFAKLLKVICIHGVHVRYKMGFGTYNSIVTSNISILGLQGS